MELIKSSLPIVIGVPFLTIFLDTIKDIFKSRRKKAEKDRLEKVQIVHLLILLDRFLVDTNDLKIKNVVLNHSTSKVEIVNKNAHQEFVRINNIAKRYIEELSSMNFENFGTTLLKKYLEINRAMYGLSVYGLHTYISEADSYEPEENGNLKINNLDKDDFFSSVHILKETRNQLELILKAKKYQNL